MSSPQLGLAGDASQGAAQGASEGASQGATTGRITECIIGRSTNQ